MLCALDTNDVALRMLHLQYPQFCYAQLSPLCMYACTCALQVCGPLPPATIQMPPPTFLPVVQIQTRKTFPIPVCTLLLYNYMYTTCMRVLTVHEHVLNCMYTCNPALVTCMTLTTNTHTGLCLSNASGSLVPTCEGRTTPPTTH